MKTIIDRELRGTYNMVIRNSVDSVEESQVVLVRNVVSVPRNHIKR